MKKVIGAALGLLTFCLSAHAQQSPERFERDLQQIQRDTEARTLSELPPDRRALIDYGGYLTVGYLSFDDSSRDNHALRTYELVGYGHLNFDGVHEFYTRGRADYRNYNSGDSFNDRPDHLEGRVEEGWYRFDLQRYAATHGGPIDGDLQLKAGRQFVDWGNGLTLDQYVDGATASIRTKTFAVDLLAGVTVRETIDFDTTRPDFDISTHRGYYGVRVSAPVGRHTPYGYFLLQRDYNRDESAATHVIPTRYRYNSSYAGIGSNGTLTDRLAYGAEFSFETGRTLSNSFDPSTLNPVNQQSDRIEALAATLRFDYVPGDTHRTRLGLEGVVASGDTDRIATSGTFAGNRAGTADHAFNSLGVIYTGLAFAPPVSNLLVLRAGASTYPAPLSRPFRGLQTGIDVFFFGKTDRNAPIDEPTGNSRYLGCEPDLFVNWQITDDVTLAIRYGVFFPGTAIPSGEQDHIRQFFYSAVTYAF